MTPPTCRCGRPTPHAVICPKCVRTLKHAARNVAAYYTDLDTTVRTKESRFGGLSSSAVIGKTQPLPIDGRFTDRDSKGTVAAAAVRATLSKWTTRLTALYPTPPTPGPICDVCAHDSCALGDRARFRHPDATVASRCGYLSRMARLAAGHDFGPQLLEDLLDLEKTLRHLIDRPAERWYAGLCGATVEPERPHDTTTCLCSCHHTPDGGCDYPGGCGPEFTVIPGVTCHRMLWAEPDSPTIDCHDCGTRHTVDARRQELLREAEDRACTVEMITRIVTTLGDRDVRASKVSARIRQWAHRGKIHAQGTRVIDGRPRPVYRVGDVLDLLGQEAATS